MKTMFVGMIKELRKFTSATGDKSITVKFEMNALGNEEVFNELNRLDRPDTGVGIIVMTQTEIEEIAELAEKKEKEKERKK